MISSYVDINDNIKVKAFDQVTDLTDIINSEMNSAKTQGDLISMVASGSLEPDYIEVEQADYQTTISTTGSQFILCEYFYL